MVGCETPTTAFERSLLLILPERRGNASQATQGLGVGAWGVGNQVQSGGRWSKGRAGPELLLWFPLEGRGEAEYAPCGPDTEQLGLFL